MNGIPSRRSLAAAALATAAIAAAPAAAHAATPDPVIAWNQFLLGVQATRDDLSLGAFQLDVGLLAVAASAALTAVESREPAPAFRRQAATAIGAAVLLPALRPLFRSTREVARCAAVPSAITAFILTASHDPAKVAAHDRIIVGVGSPGSYPATDSTPFPPAL